MKLILQKDVKNLGKAGDQVSVKNGFARNFLIPKGYAFLLNKDRLRAWNHQKTIIEAKKRKAVSERQKIIDRLSSIKLVFERESQKDNKIFGSVTAHEISQALEEKHNVSVDKRDIHFSELKAVGNHKINIQLDSELKTEILLTIKGKIRKKQETAPVQKIDKEELLKGETASELLQGESDSSEAKDQTDVVSKLESSSSNLDIKDDQPSDQTNETQKSVDSFEKKVSVKKSQTEDEKQVSSQSLTAKKSEEFETTEKDKTLLQSEKKLEEDLQIAKKDPLKQKEKLQEKTVVQASKKELQDEVSKTETKDKASEKVTTQKKPKKSGGILKKLFGK